jgi:hypothetical protein
VHSFVVTNFVCWISSCWMTKQATTTVQCNAMQPSSPAQRAFPQMCDDLHASCQVKYLTNPTCFCFWLWLWFHTQQTSNSPWLQFFFAISILPECHPNVSKWMQPKHLQRNATQTSPKGMPPKHLPKTNPTQISPQNECHPNISSLDAWPLLYNSFATMMTKVERGSTHKRIPLYNGFFS